MSKLRLRQSETALSFSSDCPTAGLPEPTQLPPAASRETELAPPRHRPTSAPAHWGSGGPRCRDVMAASRLPPATLTLKQVPTILAGLLGQLYWVWGRFSTVPCTHSIEGSRGLLGRTTLCAPHSDWLGRGGGGGAGLRAAGVRREAQGGWGYSPVLVQEAGRALDLEPRSPLPRWLRERLVCCLYSILSLTRE